MTVHCRISRLTCLLFFVCVPAQRNSVSADERPNIVLVMCDDLGWGDPQCYDPKSPIRTPHIDAMAKAGLKFDRFYAAAPVCSPTRGSCLTGRHPYRYGIYSANTGHMKPEEITLPELLQKEGYSTGHFGKWHLGTLTTEIKDANRGGPKGKAHFSTPQMNGYDTCFVTESKVPTFDPMIKPPNALRTAWDFLRDRSNAQSYGTRYWDENGRIVKQNLEGDDSRIIMDRAIPFMERAVAAKKPFFAAVWFHAPHLPVVAGPKHVAPYAKFSVLERNYYGCVTALDEQVGRLRAKLRELNVAENTMLWFCSDNGPEGQAGKAPGSAWKLRGRKRSLYEGGVRVPGIVEWPGKVKAGTRTDFAAVTSDYLPTILDVLKLRMPDQRPIDGVSLKRVLEGFTARRSKAIGFQSGKQRSYVGQRFKLYSSNAGKTWELYDLIDDPAETRDLANEQANFARSLRYGMDSWIASCKSSDQGRDYPKAR